MNVLLFTLLRDLFYALLAVNLFASLAWKSALSVHFIIAFVWNRGLMWTLESGLGCRSLCQWIQIGYSHWRIHIRPESRTRGTCLYHLTVCVCACVWTGMCGCRREGGMGSVLEKCVFPPPPVWVVGVTLFIYSTAVPVRGLICQSVH